MFSVSAIDSPSRAGAIGSSPPAGRPTPAERRTSAGAPCPRRPLDTAEALLPKAAELRANGSSWARTARDLGHDPQRLKALAAESRQAWRRLRGQARGEVIEDAFAEAVLALRTDIRTGQPKEVQSAGNMLVKLWMTLVRHYGRAPAGRRAEAPELSPWLRYCL
jgi:hypothetical protein